MHDPDLEPPPTRIRDLDRMAVDHEEVEERPRYDPKDDAGAGCLFGLAWFMVVSIALFFLGEYCAMVVMASLTTVFFLGGSEVPFWADAPWFVQLGAFMAKTGFFLFLFLWVRWTLPRFRFDQLMSLGWKAMLPLALANVFVTGALASFGVFG